MTSFESPDEVLVLAAILGNLDAFEQLVVRYRPAVVRLARSIVGNDHAEDIAQDALLLAFKAWTTIDEPSKFAAWLSAITRHRALRFGKTESLHMTKRVALDEALLDKIEALTRPIADKERDESLVRALDSLPAEYGMP